MPVLPRTAPSSGLRVLAHKPPASAWGFGAGPGELSWECERVPQLCGLWTSVLTSLGLGLLPRKRFKHLLGSSGSHCKAQLTCEMESGCIFWDVLLKIHHRDRSCHITPLHDGNLPESPPTSFSQKTSFTSVFLSASHRAKYFTCFILYIPHNIRWVDELGPFSR